MRSRFVFAAIVLVSATLSGCVVRQATPRYSCAHLAQQGRFEAYDSCMRLQAVFDAEREQSEEAAAYASLRRAGEQLQATGNEMLSRPRPTLSSPPSAPIPASAGDGDWYGRQVLEEIRRAPRPDYCQPGSLFNQTTACPH